MFIADKLIAINTEKQNIKQAIIAKGVVMDNIPFTDYHTKIAEITSGGGELPALKYYRPSDWLEPPVLNDDKDEFYFLIAVTDGKYNGLPIYVYGPGVKTIIYLGQSSIAPITINAGSGGTYNSWIDGNNINEETRCQSGYKQMWIKVESTRGGISNLYLYNKPTGYTFFNYYSTLLEVRGTSLSTAFAASSSSAAYCKNTMLEAVYFKDGISFIANAFHSIPIKLIDVGTYNNSTFSSALYSGYYINNFPSFLSYTNITNYSYAFVNCYNLITVGPFKENGINCTNWTGAFSWCQNLCEIKGQLDLSNITSSSQITNLFSSCYKLEKVDFVSGSIKYTISFENTSLSRETLVTIFTELADLITLGIASQTITITNTPGANDLTAEERAIATNKGWTITG